MTKQTNYCVFKNQNDLLCQNSLFNILINKFVILNSLLKLIFKQFYKLTNSLHYRYFLIPLKWFIEPMQNDGINNFSFLLVDVKQILIMICRQASDFQKKLFVITENTTFHTRIKNYFVLKLNC